MRTAKTVIRLGQAVDAHADLSLRWVHMSFCWNCRVAAHLHIAVFFIQKCILVRLINVKHVEGYTHQHLPLGFIGRINTVHGAVSLLVDSEDLNSLRRSTC